jgi:uncharacterized membrane protein YvbJ
MMVYCHNCGTKNEDDDEFCSKCGTSLKQDNERRYRQERRQRRRDECFGMEQRQHPRNECFGLPGGNIIVPLIIGVFLILAGLSSIYGFQYLQYLGPALIVFIGLLIIAGAIYRARRKN